MVRHCEVTAFIPLPGEQVFAHLDQHTLLSSHMGKPSSKMGWGRMEARLDEHEGKRIGSHIRLAGRVFGMNLSVEEVITEYQPPLRKVWETAGMPRLLVIGKYRMGFELTPRDNGSLLRVFIDYELPARIPARWLGFLLGGYYAKWCTQQMAGEAIKHLAGPENSRRAS